MACTPSREKSIMPTPVSTECVTNSMGATNRKENSSGSVTPSKKEVSAAGIRMALAAVLRSGLAVTIMARAAAVRPNILLMPRASHTTVALLFHRRAGHFGEIDIARSLIQRTTHFAGASEFGVKEGGINQMVQAGRDQNTFQKTIDQHANGPRAADAVRQCADAVLGKGPISLMAKPNKMASGIPRMATKQWPE